MKKLAITTDECADRFRATTDALLSEGAARETIVEALVIVAIEAGHKSRRPEAVLDAAEKAFGNAAYVAFEGAKKDRAGKRRERLGLPKDLISSRFPRRILRIRDRRFYVPAVNPSLTTPGA